MMDLTIEKNFFLQKPKSYAGEPIENYRSNSVTKPNGRRFE